jgi:DNA repair protein RadD
MSYTLRPYQEAATQATLDYLMTKSGNPVISAAPGSGKSILIAELCRRAIEIHPATNIIIAVSAKELVRQNYEKLKAIWPEGDTGIYSAGLNKKQIRKVTFVSIQSVFRKAFKFPSTAILICDECHHINKRQVGIWHKFIGDLRIANPELRVVGYSGTPFRLTQGLITEGEGTLFDEVVYDIDIISLIDAGWLSPLFSHRTVTKLDVSKVGKRNGDYIESQLQAAVNIDSITQNCVTEIVAQGEDRKCWLAFCSGIEHAFAVRDAIRARGYSCETVTGETPRIERDKIIEDYKNGLIRCVTNNAVMITGVDIPQIDLIAFLRPTQSPIIWTQGLGRGLRLADGKKDCKVLDFPDNGSFFGPLDKIRVKAKESSGLGEAPVKMCGNCMSVVPASARECKECGYVFPIDTSLKISDKASGSILLSNQLDIRTLTVRSVHYSRHRKEGRPDTFKATYIVNEEIKTFPEWTSPESDKRSRFEAWWRKRSNQLPPKDVTGCLELQKTLRNPTTITVRANGKYHDILGYTFEETPKCHEAFDKLFQGEKPWLNTPQIPSVQD